MTFPFEILSSGSRELGLVVGVLLGMGFGFVLERAGFGRATKLAAQFYLTDMTVFKVMFTAIVTAMLGLVACAGFGLVDLRGVSELIASWTYIWPMLIGGLLLGVGFIVSGYCPGTSLVASASGNVDGMFAFVGVIAGTFFYSELQEIPAFLRFHNSSEKGAWFLYDLIKVPPAVIAIAIAAMAVGAFAGAEKVEKIFAKRVTSLPPQVDSPRRAAWLRIAAPTFAAIAVFALVAMAIPRPTTAASTPKSPSISSADLARSYVSEPWRFRFDGDSVVDVTSNRSFAIAGGASAFKREPLIAAMTGGAAFTAAAPPRPAGVIAAPKKKGGGCSS